MNENKRHILFVDTGFKYDMDVTYGPKLRQLSYRFRGTVITFGEVGFHRFGSFSVHSFSILKSKLLIFLRAYFHGLRLVRRGRRNGMPVDLIISYDALNTGLLGLCISRTCGIPLITEVNGDYTNWSNYADIPNPTKRRLRRWLFIKVETFVLSRANGIKLLYTSQLDYFRKAISERTVVRTFPNFLDLTAFNNLGETTRVVIVGFPFAVKGIDIAIAAFKSVAAEFPGWSMEVLGWYKGTEKQLLDECISGHPQISHHEQIFKREMPEYIGRSGVVLCASRTEGFPRVIKEAMYAGKPCIVSTVGGLPEAIQHGLNGLLFQNENIQDLAKQLRVLLSSAELRVKLGMAAQDYAHRNFTNRAYLDYFVAFTRDVIDARHRSLWLPGRRR
jgi:glycosyltransferase involved in cell wall biosynthesis